MPSLIFRLCDAYESGIGSGLSSCVVTNPFPTGSDPYEAWAIGYALGVERALTENDLPGGDA